MLSSYVMYPDEKSIKEIHDNIQTILDGGKLKSDKKNKNSKGSKDNN